MYKWLIAVLFLVMISACGNNEEPKEWQFIYSENVDDKILPGINPIHVNGSIIIAGSSTVFPLTAGIVERFIDEGSVFSFGICNRCYCVIWD